MVKNLVIIFFTIYLFSGCGSSKESQPENIYIDYNKYRKEQILSSLIRENTKYSLINEYRKSAINKVNLSSFNSDTIIYYEKIVIPSMSINNPHYYCNIYLSNNSNSYSYKNREVEKIIELKFKDPSPVLIRNEYLEEDTELFEFKEILFFLKQGNIEGLLKKKEKRVLTDAGHSTNLLLIAIKRSEFYNIRLYQNISLVDMSPSFEIEPLNYEGVVPNKNEL